MNLLAEATAMTWPDVAMVAVFCLFILGMMWVLTR